MHKRLLMRRRSLALAGLALALVAVAAAGGTAKAATTLTPGAVFAETNHPAGNSILAFNRNADGTLTLAQTVPTGGTGRAPGNPPDGFPILDSAGPVQLSDDGDGHSCLFAVNAGSNSVSSFRYSPQGLQLADVEPTGGSRPNSVTTTSRGPGKLILYVLNSDFGSSSIQGYTVSGQCRLTPIPGSHRLPDSPASVPAQISFDQHGRFLAVSERLTNEIDIFPVDANGVAGAPVVNPAVGDTPYGLAWNNHDVLSVSNEFRGAGFVSTVETYRVTDAGALVPIGTAASPGAACWNRFTNDGRFLYISNPLAILFGGGNETAYAVVPDGSISPTPIDAKPTRYAAIDNALSHDSSYLYVLSVDLLGTDQNSAIDEYALDPQTGTMTPIGTVVIPGGFTSGLAAW